MINKKNWEAIYRIVSSLPVFSDHDHHLYDNFFTAGMTLDKALEHTCVSWMGYVPDGSEDSRRSLLENARFNSYFTWFERGVQTVHGFNEPITMESWERISRRIHDNYEKDPDFHWKSLKENGFEKLVLDTYWNPGEDNGHEEVFIPTFRIDKFMHGFHADSVANVKHVFHADPVAPVDFIDFTPFIPWERYGFSGGSLDDYVELMRTVIIKRYRAGKLVAFKCGEAYFRPISFLPDDREEAEKAFGLHPDIISEQQKILFGNYIFNRCCELAEELNVPIQIHTGLAELSGSKPIYLEPIIARYSKIRFILFHSGYPWIHEISGLAHNYRNAYPSLTWTPTICTSAAVRALNDYIDVTPSINTITWGSDCWVPEDSIGAMLAWRYVVTTVLEERFSSSRLRQNDIEILARKLMYENGRSIYLNSIHKK